MNPAPHTTEWKILPENAENEFKEIENGHITFDLENPQNLTFIVSGDYTGRVLHLFANPFEKDIVSKSSDVIYFGPGFHEINPEGDRTLHLKSNQTMYVAGGAFIKGFVDIQDAKNVRICGRGIIAQFPDMKRQLGTYIRNSENVTVEGVILNRNRDHWTGLIYQSKKVHIEDLKVVSPTIWSTDGFNIANSSDIIFDNCFFRAGDDNIAIKGLGDNFSHSSTTLNPQDFLPNRNISISNCIFWSDNNNAVVLGQETLTSGYENILIKDCNVLFVRDDEPIKAALAIISLHGTNFRNITFENITVGPCGQLITAFYTEEVFRIKGSQKWQGTMQNIHFKNITTSGPGSKQIRIEGMSPNDIDISLDNVIISGQKIIFQNDKYISAKDCRLKLK